MLYHARSLKHLGHDSDAKNVIRVALQNSSIRKTEWFSALQNEL